MRKRSVDAVVIGAGSAGLNAVSELDKAGADWVLVEAGPYGTTCARVGCMPSKLLVAAGDAADAAARAGELGVRVRGLEVDGAAVLARVRRERDRFVRGVVEDTQAWPAERRVVGRARFAGPTTIRVDSHTELAARTVVIAAGSAAVIPPAFDGVRSRLLTSDDVFDLPALPASLAVVGAGIVGLELGQALHRLGVDVSFLDRQSALGPLSDPELQAYVGRALGRRLDLQLGAEIEAAEATEAGVRLVWTRPDGERHAREYDRVLLAAGRRPNLADLHLKASGLELDERGMPPWSPQTTQCGDAPIFLAGDVNDHAPLLHEAADEGRIAGENAARFPNVAAHVRRAPLVIVFTDPQMAIAGQSHASLDRDRTEIAEVSFETQGRARVIARNEGLARLYANRDDCVLRGAELFGPEVEHLAHLLAWGVQQRLTVQRLLEMPFYHPVLEEGLRTGLRRLARGLGVESACPSEALAVSPGM